MLYSKGQFLELTMGHLEVLKRSGIKHWVEKSSKEVGNRVAGECFGRAEVRAGDSFKEERAVNCIQDVRAPLTLT